PAYVPIPVIRHKQSIRARWLDGQETADTASALHSAAEVGAPKVRANDAVRAIEFSNEVPSVINKLVRARGHIRRSIPCRDDLLNPPALVIISEIQFLLCAARHGAECLHAHQPVFSIPGEGPAAVIRLVPIRVVAVALRGRGHKHFARVGAASWGGHTYILPH